MWWKVTAIVFVVLVVVVAAAIICGTNRWRSGTRDLHAGMEATRVPVSPTKYNSGELEGLPALVQRYFRKVLKDGQLMVTAVNIEHTGTFNMNESKEKWVPFTSRQRVVTRRPGFVWDARVRMAPGFTVHVHDAYVAGEGILHAKLFGTFPVMNQVSTPELAHGELMRFFAEAVWYPTSLLPSQGVTWEAMDNTRASATITDGTTTIKLVFRFDSEGLIDSVYADGRYRELNGGLASVPWQGRHWGYEMRDGMLVPLEGEVAWLFPDGAKPYWRGRISRLRYEFAE
ncbi:MAG: hypothetical protein RB296_06010 [Acidobacteriota bacterium]|jgi:hypothetical protein|nr:hypothetical protein [Acidobacteriota bacterium]